MRSRGYLALSRLGLRVLGENTTSGTEIEMQQEEITVMQTYNSVYIKHAQILKKY